MSMSRVRLRRGFKLFTAAVYFPLAGDETYQDIFQDFTQMASNDPELLNRYQQYNTPRPGP